MLSKEEIEQAFEEMEYFIDDDYGGQYKSVVGNQDANSMLEYLKIRDYILNIQDRLTKLETEKQNVIEKLEEDKKKYISILNDNSYEHDDEREQFIGKMFYIDEILSLVKGKNK